MDALAFRALVRCPGLIAVIGVTLWVNACGSGAPTVAAGTKSKEASRAVSSVATQVRTKLGQTAASITGGGTGPATSATATQSASQTMSPPATVTKTKTAPRLH